MMDWSGFAAAYWNREPGVVACPSPVPLQRAYDAIVTASEPFHEGTRFFALPDVRFFATDGRLRAPGHLLPDAADATVDDYLKRMDASSPGDSYLLAVEQPLMLDFGLWSGVRDLISGLWRQVGWPNLPVVAELAIGSEFTRREGLTSPARHVTLVWVLEGSLAVRLRPERTLTACAGQLLYVPAAYRYALVYGKHCVALCLRVPADGRLAVTAVRDVVAEIMQSKRAPVDAVPFLGLPTEPVRDSAGDALPKLAAIGDEVRGVLDSPVLARILRIKWAARRSAGGLEPVPPPRSGDVADVARIRLASEVVRLPDGPDRWVWAVNGHVFQVRGTDGERVLALLSDGDGIDVNRLCRTGDGERGQSTLALLNKLYSLRGVGKADEG